jgi:hypothetical protein
MIILDPPYWIRLLGLTWIYTALGAVGIAVPSSSLRRVAVRGGDKGAAYQSNKEF